VEPFIKIWDSFWFPLASPWNLAVCRVVVVLAQLLFFFPSLAIQINLLENGPGFIEPQLFMQFLAMFFPNDFIYNASTFQVLYGVTIIAGITCVIGLVTRLSAFVFATGNWFLIAHNYSYAEEHHPEAILCMFLMMLAFAPSGQCLSLDAVIRRWRDMQGAQPLETKWLETAVWPLRLTQVLLSLAYFSTGLVKMVYGGLEWLNGYTLQQSIFRDAVRGQHELGIWLAQQHELCWLLSFGVVFFELFFFVSVLWPRTAWLWIIGGSLMHIGIFVTMGAPFFQHIVLYVVFLNFEAWRRPRASQLALSSR
jgi:hypothetical protein